MVSFGKIRVCAECITRVGPQEASRDDVLCARCGDAMGMESSRFAAAMGVSECTMCRLAPPEFERAAAFATYDNEMREMLHLLKFGGMRTLAEHVLGERLAAVILKLRAAAGDDLVVVPVPLFAARERERGFNQAKLLADAAVKRLRKVDPACRLNVNCTALKRVRQTREMYSLNPSQRRRNLRGAFRVTDAAAIRAREVLLIDDIMTTGATARECARVLLRAGATKVWVATVAKAQPESVGAVAEASDFAMWSAPAPQPQRLVEPDIERRMSF
jgi:ComF family protein